MQTHHNEVELCDAGDRGANVVADRRAGRARGRSDLRQERRAEQRSNERERESAQFPHRDSGCRDDGVSKVVAETQPGRRVQRLIARLTRGSGQRGLQLQAHRCGGLVALPGASVGSRARQEAAQRVQSRQRRHGIGEDRRPARAESEIRRGTQRLAFHTRQQPPRCWRMKRSASRTPGPQAGTRLRSAKQTGRESRTAK